MCDVPKVHLSLSVPGKLPLALVCHWLRCFHGQGWRDGGQREEFYTHHEKHNLGSVFKLRAFACPAAEST